jgi:hypothetical protein
MNKYESLHQMKSFINNTTLISPESLYTELNENIELDLYIDLYFRLKSELDLNFRQLKSEIDEL